MTDAPSTSDDLPDILSQGLENKDGKTVSRKTFTLPEKCSICTNPAVGYHYNVPSCNGCKAFFRRTIITGRVYTCKGSNTCMEEKQLDRSGRICGHCRFRKCVQMGMDPLLINTALVSPEGKELMEEVIKYRRRHLGVVDNRIVVNNDLSAMISRLTIAEDQMRKLRECEMPVHYWDLRSLSDVLKEEPRFDLSKVALNFKDDQLYAGHAGMSHNSYLSIVEHLKLMDFYSKISLETAKTLLKSSGVICCNMINSYYSIKSFGADNIRRQDGTVAGKPMRNYNGVWVDHRKIIQKTLHVFLRNKLDFVEYLFLKAIVICNPAALETDQQLIEEQRQDYARLLLEYCTREHGRLHGPSRFVAILSLVSVLESQKKEQTDFVEILRYFHSNVPVLVSPLYDELMNA